MNSGTWVKFASAPTIGGLQGYAGVMPQARLAFAGYTGGGMEDGVAGAVTGTQCVHVLVEKSVYHRLSILSGDIDVGLSAAKDSTGNGVCVTELGVSAALGGFNNWGGQIPAAPAVYPYKGQTGVDTTFYPISETPNPAPDLGTARLADYRVVGDAGFFRHRFGRFCGVGRDDHGVLADSARKHNPPSMHASLLKAVCWLEQV